MYTLKFVNGKSQLCISCEMYRVTWFDKCTMVSAYETLEKDKGFEVGLVSDSELTESRFAAYSICYVENETGKTVDTIKHNPQ